MIKILDCTLRDGGYCNEWSFGKKNISSIIENLCDSNIDIIECGFLTNKVSYNNDVTKFTSLDQIKPFLKNKSNTPLFVAMMNYGEYAPEELFDYDGTSLDGIRVAFHKNDIIDALEICRKIKAKGYKVFIQGMVSLRYTDKEFLDFIDRVNDVDPYAFYIVDSFGEMKNDELSRLFYLIENNLKKSIKIGFHSHNNLQLAYSNALYLSQINSSHDIIIDSSVYGMGRGAGNLNTELFIQYLNENKNGNYDIRPLLSVIDEVLDSFYQKNKWGYSLPNYLSASHHAHPNYALYLDDRKTLTVWDMNRIFEMMDEEKKASYDKSYIEDLYYRYMESGKVHDEHKEEIKERIKGKKILLIAAGKSSETEKDKIVKFAERSDVISISINYEYPFAKTDYIFVSNSRRFRELSDLSKEKSIVTSNISADKIYVQIDYKRLLENDVPVKDNAGMMAIKFFINMGGTNIILAGFDGYSYEFKNNYIDENLSVIMKNAVLEATNASMQRALNKYQQQVNISFLTSPKYLSLWKEVKDNER